MLLHLSFNMLDSLTLCFYSLMNHITGLFSSGMRHCCSPDTAALPIPPQSGSRLVSDSAYWCYLMAVAKLSNCVLGHLLLPAARTSHSAKALLQGLLQKQEVLTLRASSMIVRTLSSNTMHIHARLNYFLGFFSGTLDTSIFQGINW